MENDMISDNLFAMTLFFALMGIATAFKGWRLASVVAGLLSGVGLFGKWPAQSEEFMPVFNYEFMIWLLVISCLITQAFVHFRSRHSMKGKYRTAIFGSKVTGLVAYILLCTLLTLEIYYHWWLNKNAGIGPWLKFEGWLFGSYFLLWLAIAAVTILATCHWANKSKFIKISGIILSVIALAIFSMMALLVFAM